MNQNKGIMLAKRRWIIDLHDYRIATKEQRLRKETMAEARLKLIRMGRKDNWGLLYEKKKRLKRNQQEIVLLTQKVSLIDSCKGPLVMRLMMDD